MATNSCGIGVCPIMTTIEDWKYTIDPSLTLQLNTAIQLDDFITVLQVLDEIVNLISIDVEDDTCKDECSALRSDINSPLLTYQMYAQYPEGDRINELLDKFYDLCDSFNIHIEE